MFATKPVTHESIGVRCAILSIAAVGHAGAIAMLMNAQIKPSTFTAPKVLAVSMLAGDASVATMSAPAAENLRQEQKPLTKSKKVPLKPSVRTKSSPQTAAAEAAVSKTRNADSASTQGQSVTRSEAGAAESAPSIAGTARTEPEAVAPPRFDADYFSNPAPAYPTASRSMGEQGKVFLSVLVSPTGAPTEVRVRTSSGFNRLDQAALEAVQRWKFIPARQGDETVAAWVVVPILFSLRR